MTRGQIVFAIIGILVTLTFSGVSVSSLILEWWKNRLRTLEKRIDIEEVDLWERGRSVRGESIVSIPDPLEGKFPLSCCYIVRIDVTNRSHDKDFDDFKVAISFSGDFLPLDEYVKKPDPNYTVTTQMYPPIPEDFSDAQVWSAFSGVIETHRRDYVIHPFNRKHVYSFHFVIAPVRVRYNEIPDGAGGTTARAYFHPSFQKLRAGDFNVSAPVSGLSLTQPNKRILTRYPYWYVNTISSLLVGAVGFVSSNVIRSVLQTVTGEAPSSSLVLLLTLLIVIPAMFIVVVMNQRALYYD